MIGEANGLLKKTNFVIICINIGIVVLLLFTLSIIELSPIGLALSIDKQEEGHNNNNKESVTIATTGKPAQVVSNINNPLNQTTKASTATISSSSSANSSNITNKKITAATETTKTPSEYKVLIGGEESEKPFNPDPINIKMGSTITWTNTDVETHTVTSGSPDSNTNKGNEFDSGNLNPKQTFEHTFSKAGTYSYFCVTHPSMTGIVDAK
jgi:plastocyanin